jgi:hypothetical protein
MLTFAVAGDPLTILQTMRGGSDPGPPWFAIRAENLLLARTSLGGVAVAFGPADGTWTVAVIDPNAVGGRPASTEPPPTFEPDKPVPWARVARIAVPSSSEVVAVLDHLDTDRGGAPRPRRIVAAPALLLLENDRRQLRFTTGGDGPDFSIALSGRAVHVVVDAATRIAACITDTAELLLVALAWRSIYARFTGQGRVA